MAIVNSLLHPDAANTVNHPAIVRLVLVDEPEQDKIRLLKQIFYYGQNCNRVSNSRSVSVGDVIQLADEEHYLVESLGFSQVSMDR